ncbi:MAG TPA: UDP-2,3-diacylglucosamine diphosphatase [Gammaproteobacteria bacterium]|nr:UDP-2,3-diacylglucosamine diphosphatase [Gammaproteobacteria bacterium]
MSPVYPMRPLRYRAIWVSDVHLGYRGCRADFLLDFLHATECEYLYLVGDIVDVWNMKRGLYWPQEHNNVLRTVLGKAKHGTKVVYIPGNHDEIMREYDGMVFGNVEIRTEATHVTADGRRLLMLHGDEFDSVVKCSRLVALLGTRAYDALLRVNHWVNLVRRRFGFPYWSLAAYLKHKVKNAVKYISNFEYAIAHEARRRGVDGLVCGHIHRAEMTTIDGVLYCNDGDWVESCTALVERHDGELQILRWAEERELVKSVAAEQKVRAGDAA